MKTPMRDQLKQALKAAIKLQDKRRMSTLRLINAAIKDRDIAARSSDKKCVSDTEVMEILAKMVKQRHESIKAYEEGGRLELVFGNRASARLVGHTLALSPYVSIDGEMIWHCGDAPLPAGLTGLAVPAGPKAPAMVPRQFLPSACRN